VVLCLINFVSNLTLYFSFLFLLTKIASFSNFPWNWLCRLAFSLWMSKIKLWLTMLCWFFYLTYDYNFSSNDYIFSLRSNLFWKLVKVHYKSVHYFELSPHLLLVFSPHQTHYWWLSSVIVDTLAVKSTFWKSDLYSDLCQTIHLHLEDSSLFH
jgi:hypothetical protein